MQKIIFEREEKIKIKIKKKTQAHTRDRKQNKGNRIGYINSPGTKYRKVNE